nr:DNRLRE domain-containing protein [Phytoactinopolyspora mesophila]
MVWSGLPAVAVASDSSPSEASLSEASSGESAPGAQVGELAKRTSGSAAVPRVVESPSGERRPPAQRAREVVSERTATAKVFELSDGRFEAELAPDPVHYLDGDGLWREIDTTVGGSSREGFAYGVTKNSFRSWFSARSDRLVRFQVDNRHVTLGVAGDRRDLEPVVDGASVTYEDVFDSADVVYTVGSAGLKEEIVLHEPPDVADGEGVEYSFTLQMGGVTASERDDGSIGFYPRGAGDEGVPVFEIPAPFMFDDTDDPDSPHGKAWSDEVTQSVSQTGANTEITLTADAAWLSDPERTYPVVIDPTIKIVPNPAAAENAMVVETSPSSNYGDNPRLSVGTTATGRTRSLVKFDLSPVPAGTRIDSAVMRLYYDQVHTNNDHDVTVGAHRVRDPWTQSTVTWNNQPSANSGTSYSRTVVDNGDSGTSQVGGWPFSTNSSLTELAWNQDYQYSKNDHANDAYTWVPELHEPGTYSVDAHYVRANDRTTVPYAVHHADGQHSAQVDQSAGSGGVWAGLGSHTFEAGTDHKVVLGGVPDSSKSVIADAVRFTRYARDVKRAGDTSKWHEFSVTATVQLWLNDGAPNYGFMLRASNEALGQGGPRYQASQYAYGGGVENRPNLVVSWGEPGVELEPVRKTYSTGAELHWSEYADDDIAEYQVHRAQTANYDPSAATLVAPVPSNRRTYTDTTATPTPADDPDPFGAFYYYMVAVKTTDGEIIPATTQIARLPKAGRVRHVFQAEVSDTSLSQSQPTDNLNTLEGSPWLMVGNNSSTYGTTRAVVQFPGVEDAIPDTATVVGGQLQLWTAHSFGGGASFDAHRLTRGFEQTEATWQRATSGSAWSNDGGDFDPQVAATVAAIPNEPYWHRWSVADVVQDWTSHEHENHGFLVKLADEAGPEQRVLFLSGEAEEPSRHPMLVVTYLEETSESTYFAPDTSVRAEAGEERAVEVTVTNTTDETWTTSDYVLSYHWAAPDGSDVTTAANRAETELPQDLAPGESVTVNASVISPALEDESNKREAFTLQWDMRNRASGQWVSNLRNIPALDQSAIVEDVTSNQLGLEKFYQYTGTNAGAGSTVLNNLHAGNTVFSYDALANPSRGVSTFVRMTYNSLDTAASSMGDGWSLATSSLMRMGTPLDFHPRGQDWPSQISLTDGDGTAHLFRLNKHGSSNDEDWDYDSPHGVNLYLQKTGSSDPTRAWVFTAPDRTQFYFDDDGYQSALADRNGNELLFTYERKKSNNKPIKFLRYLTDPHGRQTLTVDYYSRGQDYTYVDDDGNTQSGNNLTNPKIIDQVASVTDISGRTIEFIYTDKGLLAEMTDGAGDPEAKTFGFTYDMTQGNKNVKLVEVTDPRGNGTALSYFDAPTDPKAKWMLEALTDRTGGTTEFAYVDPDGPQGGTVETTVTDANGNDTVYVMDGFGRPTSTTNAKGEATNLVWDDNHNVIELEEDNGAVTSWTYDPKTGYPTSITDAQANAGGGQSTTLSYQAQLNGHVAELIEKESPEGRTWAFGYDAVGNLTSVTDPAGTASSASGDYTTSYTYDGFGRLSAETDANDNTTTYTDYHPTGYPRTITDALDNPTSFTYDSRGNVLTVVDANDAASEYSYDVFSRPLGSTEPKDESAGEFIVTPPPVYDPNDNVVEAAAPNGGVWAYEYDPADRMTSGVAPHDDPGDPERRTTYSYDAVGNVVDVVEPNGNLPGASDGEHTTTYTYDGVYQLISVTNAEGDEITYEYDNVGNVVTVVDPRKNAAGDPSAFTSQYAYDLAHRVTEATDAAGETEQTVYDLDGLVTRTIDKDGSQTRFTHDERGLVTQVSVPREAAGMIMLPTVTRYEYDEVGNRTRVITPRGVASSTEPDAFVHETVYDELNRPVEERLPYDPNDPDFNTPDVVTYEYDAVGNLATKSAPPSDGQAVRNETSYTHFDNGWIKTSTDPWDIVTSYDYNELGQQSTRTLTSSGGSSSRTMTWDYLADGKLAARSDDGVPAGLDVVLVDDSDAQNVDVEGSWSHSNPGLPGFHGTGYLYSASGGGSGANTVTWRLAVPADGDYEVFVRYVSDSNRASNAPYSIDHTGGEDTVLVDQRTGGGEWVSVGTHEFTDGGDHQIELSDDADGRVVADAVKLVRDNSDDADDPQGKTFTYTYDANGNLIEITDDSVDAEVDAYEVVYDGLNQVESVTELDGGDVVAATSFTYDENGNPLTRAHDEQYAEYTYDERDLLVEVSNAESATDTDPKVTQYSYTAMGWRASETKANGNVVTYGYFLDGLLRTQVETKADGSTVVNEHTMSYDPNGNRTEDVVTTMDADNPSGSLGYTAEYTYDPRDRVTEVTKTDTSTSSTMSTETYTHDANGNVVAQTVDGTSTSFVYDRNRLLTATTSGVSAGYNYDPFGRLDTVTAAGELLERYVYDGFDRIAEHRSPTDSGGTSLTAYTYDPLDRTISRLDDAGGAGEESTEYAYLGLSGQLISEHVDGELATSYQYSAWGQRLSQVKHDAASGEDETSFYGYNPRTDVETLTDESGDTIATYGYTAYGSEDEDLFTGLDAPDPGDPTVDEAYNVYRYNATRWDAASGTYDMGFRHYDPGLNRFLSRDMYNGALDDLNLGLDPWNNNRYAFAGGNPITRVEIDGHSNQVADGGRTPGSGTPSCSGYDCATGGTSGGSAAGGGGGVDSQLVGAISQDPSLGYIQGLFGDEYTRMHAGLSADPARLYQDMDRIALAESIAGLAYGTGNVFGVYGQHLGLAGSQTSCAADSAIGCAEVRTGVIFAGGGGLGGLFRAGSSGAGATAGAAASGGSRLARDVAVSSTAPRALPLNRSIGRASHNRAIQSDIAALPRGATDIRVNQQQVNALGQRVGINRPDLQYTLNGRRHYIEYEGLANPRGAAHRSRILANDPIANFVLRIVP